MKVVLELLVHEYQIFSLVTKSMYHPQVPEAAKKQNKQQNKTKTNQTTNQKTANQKTNNQNKQTNNQKTLTRVEVEFDLKLILKVL